MAGFYSRRKPSVATQWPQRSRPKVERRRQGRQQYTYRALMLYGNNAVRQFSFTTPAPAFKRQIPGGVPYVSQVHTAPRNTLGGRILTLSNLSGAGNIWTPLS
jgi:hypothetical protein